MGTKRPYSALRDTYASMSTNAASSQANRPERLNNNSVRSSEASVAHTNSQAQQTSPYISMFEGFRAELDEHHDRRERIIKASRDITAASKKLIFGLQRVRALGQPIHSSISKATSTHASIIAGLYGGILDEFKGINVCRYAQQISPGVQEHVEALLFERYLETQQIMTYDELRDKLASLSFLSSSSRSSIGSPEAVSAKAQMGADLQNSGQSAATGAQEQPEARKNEDAGGVGEGRLVLTPEDYILGLLDMTGEVMRFGINSIATSGELPGSTTSKSNSSAKDVDMEGAAALAASERGGSARERTVLTDLQTLRQHLSILTCMAPSHGSNPRFIKDLHGKMEVMHASVDKVERALYGLIVRGSERPKGWIPDLSSTSQAGPSADVEMVESY